MARFPRAWPMSSGLSALLLLAGCALTEIPAAKLVSQVPGDFQAFEVVEQALGQALGGVTLRVTRLRGPALTYSDGMVAKLAAENYCAGRGKRLDPGAFGAFSLPASWLFEGGCL